MKRYIVSMSPGGVWKDYSNISMPNRDLWILLLNHSKDLNLYSSTFTWSDDLGLTTAIMWYQTRNINPMLGQCWPSVYDAGPTLAQHWFNVLCAVINTITVNDVPGQEGRGMVYIHARYQRLPTKVTVFWCVAFANYRSDCAQARLWVSIPFGKHDNSSAPPPLSTDTHNTRNYRCISFKTLEIVEISHQFLLDHPWY